MDRNTVLTLIAGAAMIVILNGCIAPPAPPPEPQRAGMAVAVRTSTCKGATLAIHLALNYCHSVSM